MKDSPSNGSAHVIDDDRLTENDNLVWSRFVGAADSQEFCQSWLAIQCRQIIDVAGGVVLLQGEDGLTYNPVAVWPDVRQDMQHLTETAQQALRERRGVVAESGSSNNGNTCYEIAYPVSVSNELVGVVVLELENRTEAQLQAALRQLHWGIAWLIDRFRNRLYGESTVVRERVMSVLDLAAVAVEQKTFRAAATAFVTELATQLKCDRVSLGFVVHNNAKVLALSHSAHFNDKANLVRAIETAMDEAIDQGGAVVVPSIDDERSAVVLRANQALSVLENGAAIASIPFSHDGEWIGAVTIERAPQRGEGAGFSREQIELCQAASALAGPMLDLSRREDRWITTKIVASIGDGLERLVGPGFVWSKFGVILAIALLAFFSMKTGDFRVRADALAEGGVLRAVVAPYDGFIAEARVRAGDVVEEGQMMAALDDQDLRLEQLKWESQRDQYQKELRQSKASRDKARIGILGAQLDQAEAQLALVNEQLTRTQLIAPQAGVIVSGDLSKNLGAPLTKGDVLFEIAPLDNYRIVLNVDDRDISSIEVGQAGDLILSAIPERVFPIEVTLVTPVANTEEGRNYFRVEARLSENSPRLRPGMEGVAKIGIGERKLIWIWTHRLTDWLKLWLWSWWP